MYDALQLMVNQGEVFASCGCIYLQPAHVTSLLKPLVDHRLDRAWAIPRAYEHTNEPFEHSPSVQMLLSAVDVLTTSGELRDVVDAGYAAFGFFGGFERFHTALDDATSTSAALLHPVGTAIADAIVAAYAANAGDLMDA